VLEYDPLLDSSNMTYDDYVHLANDIYVSHLPPGAYARGRGHGGRAPLPHVAA